MKRRSLSHSYLKQAKELAAACDVTLLDRADLQKFINEVNPVFKAREIFENITPEPRKCPKCGQDLVVRLAAEIMTPIQQIHEEIAETDNEKTIAEKIFRSNVRT
ncbi:MAG: hypothetical protein WCE77_01580, partial [Priestia megaterium]